MTARRLTWFTPVLFLMAMAPPVLSAQPKTMTAKTTAPKIDVKAVQLLRQTVDYMSGLQNFSVHVQTTRDLVLPTDQALSSDLTYDLMIRRPNGLRVNMTSAAGQAQIFYDGKTMTVFTPGKNLYAMEPAPGTIEETIKTAMKRGISMPLAELFSRDSRGKLITNVESATFVGTSLVGGVMTNHLAFRQKGGIDWQLWIEDSDTPLPRRIVIIDRQIKDYPRFVATLSEWNTNPSFDESIFSFTPPEGAQKIKFRELPKLRNYGKQAPGK